ncbi:MAG TPA: histidine-type phosphatase [Caulobacteraceae bacterium]|nr:histidine-type phosphatase [Caulobacteraceae bacterium]
MRAFAFAAALAAVVACLGASSAIPAAKPKLQLERIVVVMRHGVRSPTASPEALSKLTPQAWPAWPVAPGLLTDHGQADVRLMGDWLRADYARRGLWPATGCPAPGAVAAWADGGDQRTRVSGQTALDGAFPGCGLTAPHGPDDQGDGFFSATAQGVCPIDPEQARAAVMAEAKGGLDDPALAPAKAALTRVVMGDRACTDEKACALAGSSRLKTTEDGVKLSGPLGTGATFAENLLLEYAQGLPASEVGWGRADAAAIAQVMPIHDAEADLERRTPYIATHNGAVMMHAVLAALRGQPALPGGGVGARLTLIAGHDTNISNLSGILGADWTLPGQPDKTPPGAALVFEVWKNAKTAERFVRVAVVYQTLEDLRGATPLTVAHPAGRVDVPVPGCADGPSGDCRLQTFASMVGARLPAECVGKL